LTGASFIFFAQHVLKLGHNAGILLMVYFLSGIAGIPLWTRLAVRLGKHRCYVVACAYSIVLSPLLAILPKDQLWLATIAFAAFGLNYGAFSLLLRAMMSDVTDIDRLETGRDRSGLYFAMLTMAQKLGYGLPLIIFYPFYKAIGFNPASTTNSPQALAGLAAVFVAIPVIIGIVSIALMRRYPIDQARQEEVRRAIDISAAQAVPSE